MRSSSLGPDFTRLITARTISSLGDGITLAAGPLLLASVTDSPTLVAGGLTALLLPWLLFSLVSGVIVDRVDRRRLVVVVDLARGAVIGALALAVLTDHVSVPLIYVCLFLLGTGETLSDNAARALVPAVVADDALPRANSRLAAVNLVVNQLGAPPLGAALFVLAAALPFGIDAVTFVVAAMIVAGVRGVPKPAPKARATVRRDIATGLRWLWRHDVLRTLCLCLALMNLTLTGGFAIMVLYTRERLGLDPSAYGLMLAASAVGGLPGTALAPALIRRFGAPALLRLGLVVEAATHLGLALTTTAWVAFATMAAFGLHAVVWNVICQTISQRAVPDELRGRVGSTMFLLTAGGSAIGALTAGLLAERFGVTAPFWLGVVAVSALVVAAWRPFGRADATATIPA
ncbi:MFS transporter [Saccharothrix violaceirubra]|uniref:MFS family permease n=1 Tax=Saccharothrix violaceirubra TaxID=413306 RepID=A0A7W7WVY3_9PSEU|nr:MFS transporter [Saccharothrix violaceirubra]MBB4965810.1 MFS family permease [Saccharothrix violaceirubra]